MAGFEPDAFSPYCQSVVNYHGPVLFDEFGFSTVEVNGAGGPGFGYVSIVCRCDAVECSRECEREL